MSQTNSKKRNRTFQVILCYKENKQGSVVEDLISRKEHSSEFTEHVLYVFVELWDVITNPITYVRKVKLREIKPLAEGQRARCWESLNVHRPVLTAFLEQRLFYVLQMSARMIPSSIPEFLAFSLSLFFLKLFIWYWSGSSDSKEFACNVGDLG